MGNYVGVEETTKVLSFCEALQRPEQLRHMALMSHILKVGVSYCHIFRDVQFNRWGCWVVGCGYCRS